MERKLSIPHRKFINLVASGQTQALSYKLSIGKKGVSKAVCEVKGSQLSKRYADLITIQREKLSEVITQARKSEVVESALKSVLSVAERLEWLTKLVNGEIKAKQPFVIGGKIMEYPSEPSHNDRIKALAELNKMDGAYAVERIEVTNIGKAPVTSLKIRKRSEK